MKIIRKSSPNHFNGRNGWKADVIVFHQTGGTSAAAALSWYLRNGSDCSPHFVIDTNGDVYQLIDLDNGAWCNGTGTNPNAKLYYGLSTAKLVKARKTNANYYTYSMEFVHCQYGNINEAQVAAAIELIKTVILPHMQKNGVTPQINRDHFIGHCEIDPVTRAFCPGKQFPYGRIIDGVLGKAANAAESVKPTVSTPSQNEAVKVGDKVTIKETATTYAGASTNVKIPARYKGGSNVYTISKVSGEMSLLKELYSWVWNKDLDRK
ncbi:MAG: N-acetylmuramoyl-L-alanine amidase [Bacteroides sp.]|nr:N-acetylmuramoyl-L-alanine amidase [Eubacterium sp.]MCM1418893.1 N-acetylmuramoyl-L-alanine amidase [Roseburia sp.]MCM1463380.1 N-acetylmuramoyl-L-alanine amidase [Bacteroides sp.]